jgi:hypothetical protein
MKNLNISNVQNFDDLKYFQFATTQQILTKQGSKFLESSSLSTWQIAIKC